MSYENDPNFSTFEVTLPKGVNENTLALYGLANALGWNIKERAALVSDMQKDGAPSYMKVSTEDLQQISAQLWGTEVYGENAQRFLDEEKRDINSRYYIHTRQGREKGLITASSDLAYRYRRNADDYSADLGSYYSSHRWPPHHNSTEQAELERMVTELWPRTVYPFEAPKVVPGKPRWESQDEYIWWDMEAGQITRVRLAHYARVRGIAEHVLRGAVGKTHDVINVAAGLTTQDKVIAKHDGAELEFVDYREFKSMLKDSGLTRHAQSEIQHEINFTLGHYNIGSGTKRPWGTSEIVVEGAGGWVSSGGSRVPHFEKIAKLSLAHLFADEPPTRHVAPRQFLAQFA